MRSIDDYLDAAKASLNLPSDRQLGFALRLKGNIVTQYRTRRVWPNDEVMVRIAEAAKLDPQTALLELGYWRTTARNETHAAALYKRLISSAGHALVVLFFVLVFLSPAPAEAATIAGVAKSGDFILWKIIVRSLLSYAVWLFYGFPYHTMGFCDDQQQRCAKDQSLGGACPVHCRLHGAWFRVRTVEQFGSRSLV